MKRFLSLALAVIMTFAIFGSVPFTESPFAIFASAADESVLTFTLSDDGTYYSVTGCNSYAKGDLIIPSEYNGLPVKVIESKAFYWYMNLTSITLPETITFIGSEAFMDCYITAVYVESLTAWCNINFEDESANPLYHAQNLYINNVLVTDIVIPEGITSIGNYAFCCCANIISVTIPNGVTSIGESSFAWCPNITSVTIGNSVTSIAAGAFSGCENLEAIYISDLTSWCNISFESAFSNPLYFAGNLYINNVLATDITIPDNITTVNNYTFINCTSLTSVTIPDSITALEKSVFSGCTNLESIDLSEGVLSIGPSCFSGCTNLESIDLPESVLSIGPSCFSGCTVLASINLPDSTNHIGVEAFSDTAYINNESNWENGALYIGKHLVLVSPSVTSEFNIKENTITIAEYAFDDCTSITSVKIPDSVTNINNDAFYDCVNLVSVYINSLTSWCNINFEEPKANPLQYNGDLYVNDVLATDIVFPESISQIGNHSFSGCASITSVTIPDNIVTVGDYAFYNCKNLSSVVTSESITSLGRSAFHNCSSLVSFTVPEGVTYLRMSTFEDCSNLTSIVIPDSITYIEAIAFSGCDNLTYVFYAGSESEWSAITMNYGNTALTDAAIHYNSTTHTYSTEWTIDTEPTCTEDGSKSYHCEYCNIKKDVTIIEASGHDYSTEWTVDTEPTCTAEGSKSRHCTVCGDKSEVTPIDALGHEYSTEWTIDKETSCSEEGSQSRHCTVCGDKTDITAIEKLPHTYSTEWTIDKETSCAEEGSKSRHCTVCGDKTDVTVIEKLPHTPAEHLIHAPGFNCESGEINYMYRLCSVCKAVLEVFEVEPGHSYVDGICEKCGNCNFSFTVSNGKVTITGYTGPIGQVTIPTTIGGYPVEKVDANAFSGNSRITDIIIPDGMIIGDGAFDSAPNLKTVTISNNVTFGTDVFVDSTLEKVIFTDDVVDVQENCFNGNTSIKEVVFGSNVKTVGASAFNGCTALESIYIPESVDTIGDSAFCGCTALEKAVIDGAATIGVGAFQDCAKLLDVAIGDKTETIGESAFAKSGVNDLVLGNNVKTIGARAFENAKNLQVVYLPDGIQTINEEAFYYSGLQTIILPDSVETVGNEAFATINLKYAQLGTGLKNVGEVAFYGTLMNVVVPKEAEGFVQGSIVVNDFTEIYYDGTEEQFLQLKENSVFMSSSESFDASTVTYVNSLPLSSGYADDYCYFEYPAGDINVVDYLGYDLSVVLPSSINGKPVTDIYTTFIPVLDLIDLIDDGVEEQQVAEWFCPSEITLSENITEIGDFAFIYCLGLETLNLPETLTSIGNAAFGYCLKLTNINLPHSLKRIGFEAFGYSAIEDTQENWENNVLYWENCLIDVSSSFTGDLVVKDGTHLIADGVATGSTGIQDLHLPESLEIIGESAFSGIFRVEANIGGEETVVSDPTQYIFYKGTQDQWDDIVIHNDNDIFAMYPVHFEATDHTIASEWETDVTPGCTHGGTQVKKCLYCTYKITGELTATGHTLENGVCKYCTSEVAESAHYFEESIDETVTLHKETAGSVTLTFSEDTYAGYIYIYDANDTLIGEYAGSDLAGETIIVQGNTVKIRLVSSGNMNEYGYYADVLWACAHTPAELVNVKEATCEEDGYTGDVYCQNCSYTFSEGEVIEATGHSMINGFCQNCDHSVFRYSIADGHVTITDYRGENTIVEIPSTIGGYPVTALGEVFSETPVAQVIIPASVASIDMYCFPGAYNLTSITVAEDNPNYTSEDGVLFNKEKTALIVYPANKADEVYEIPEGVVEIEPYAFGYTKNLKEVVFPESTTTINEFAFYMSSLEKFNYTDSIKTVGSYAFAYTDAVKFIEINENTEFIGECAFLNFGVICVLPASVENLAQASIYGISDMTVYYDGTEEQMAQLIADEKIVGGGNLTVIYGESVTSNTYGVFRYIETTDGEISIYDYNGNDKVVEIPSEINGKKVVDIRNTFTNLQYDFETGEIVSSPIEKIIVPDTVCKLSSCAFSGNGRLYEVVLPDNITHIGSDIFNETAVYYTELNWYEGGLYVGNYLVDFSGSPSTIKIKDGTKLLADDVIGHNTKEIYIPASVEYIGENIFSSSTNLTSVFYGGNQEQWKKIIIAEYNDGINNAVIHYNATGHTNGNWIVDILPTTTQTGSRHKECSVCGNVTEEEKLPATTGFEYDLNNETYTLLSFYDTQAEVIIPEEYNGKPVTAIGSGCFKDDMFVESIIIPETVTEIGSLAFMNCENLETVRIPESVTSIGKRAFYGFSGKIICYYGSFAHQYAHDNGIDYFAITIEAIDSLTSVDYENNLIFTTMEATQQLSELIKTASVLNAESSVEVSYYGTGNIIQVKENGTIIEEYTLVVDGDLNGDSVCDVLDAFFAGRVVNEHATATTAQVYAANGEISDEIDIITYQRLVNKAVS